MIIIILKVNKLNFTFIADVINILLIQDNEIFIQIFLNHVISCLKILDILKTHCD